MYISDLQVLIASEHVGYCCQDFRRKGGGGERREDLSGLVLYETLFAYRISV